MKNLYYLIFFPFVISSCLSIFESNEPADKFPFDKSEYLIGLDKIEPYTPSSNNFTGFTIFKQKVVYRTSFYHDLYQFDLDSKVREELVLDYPGSYLAHDSIYIFYEMGNFSIWRYNTQLKTTDLKFDLPSIDYSYIEGITTYNDKVYLYRYFYPDEERSNLVSFDLNGNLIETIAISRPLHCIAIKDEVLYSLKYNTKKNILIRFNLKTKEFLPDINLSDRPIGSFCFDKDKFYFTDFKRKQIRYLDASLLPKN